MNYISILKSNTKIWKWYKNDTYAPVQKPNYAQLRPTDAQLAPNYIQLHPTAYSWAHKWPRVMMPFIKINRAAIISGWPLAFTSLRWPMRQRQMIGMLHPALKLLSWFFRWPLQNILYDYLALGYKVGRLKPRHILHLFAKRLCFFSL